MEKKKKFLISLICIALAIVFAATGVLIWYFCAKNKQAKIDRERKLAYEQFYQEKLDLFAEQNKTATNVDVVFLGDSLTDGYDVEAYFPMYNVLNRGIGGENTFGLEKRLQISVFDVKPKVATMLIGANNFDTMLDNYEDILIKFKEQIPQTKIVLLSLTAMGGAWGKNNNKAILNNQKIKSLAQKYNFVFVDLFTPLCNVETGEIFENYTVDGGHLTSEGYSVVTAQILPVLQELI